MRKEFKSVLLGVAREKREGLLWVEMRVNGYEKVAVGVVCRSRIQDTVNLLRRLNEDKEIGGKFYAKTGLYQEQNPVEMGGCY